MKHAVITLAVAVGGYLAAGVALEVAVALLDRKRFSNENITPFSYVNGFNVVRWPRDLPRVWGGAQLGNR